MINLCLTLTYAYYKPFLFLIPKFPVKIIHVYQPKDHRGEYTWESGTSLIDIGDVMFVVLATCRIGRQHTSQNSLIPEYKCPHLYIMSDVDTC